MDYAMLVVARLIGGVGIGMLSMVAPLYVRILVPLITDLMLCFEVHFLALFLWGSISRIPTRTRMEYTDPRYHDRFRRSLHQRSEAHCLYSKSSAL